ncbi:MULTISPECIES: alkaline phosphatase family protein [Pseudoalteromonas]|uniref:Phospholipase C n=1 Tax=Pseudoalteromonas amylolytica TaxID=1859457 RepID=A0A1S1MS73_9GAMM|nr:MULTISPECIES: alkaline phosphatase family protein [Pseudoalteromonas]OHU84245.1 hypothetical protein BFC16_00930 [Pseudoalteromonas sp. JW3]OHU87214.1 hypothetical protein BET10_01005 [Pseudoalteromonas amylolytica]
MATQHNIEHIVLLMLENRSLDNLLGWLYENDVPNLNIPSLKPDERAYDGLQGLDLNALTNHAEHLSQPPVRGVSGLTIPSVSPGESFEQVNMQLFNTDTQASVDTHPTMNGYLADYVRVLRKDAHERGLSEQQTTEEVSFYAPHIMETHSPVQLPVLNQLARHYAVSDQWFSSVPSQTNTNRAFSLTGTSQGLVNNGYLETNPDAEMVEEILGMGLGDDRFLHKTIFNALEESGQSWKVFWETSMIPEKISKLLNLISSQSVDEVQQKIDHVISQIDLATGVFDTVFGTKLKQRLESIRALLPKLVPIKDYLAELSSGELDSCYTYRLFPALQKDINDLESHFAKIDDFHTMARDGNLPKFSYLEPYWTISESAVDRGVKTLFTEMGNDYHPPGNLNVAENYVQAVYESLTANQQAWQKTLFIITFDEPVGAYDHIPPGPATPPWGDGEPDFEPTIGFDGKPKPLLQNGFKFDRLGGRVPTLLISPHIAPSTVFRSDTNTPFDHTSMIKTVLKLLGHEEKIAEFGERVKHAPTFENVLNTSELRNDAREVDFLQRGKAIGQPLCYYDRFYLKNQNGDYICHSEEALKVSYITLPSGLEQFNLDVGLSAYFPTVNTQDKRVIFYAQKSADRPYQGPIKQHDVIKIISTETQQSTHVVLGAWRDSHDCYYFNDYLHGDNNTRQQWLVEQINGEETLTFGTQVKLENNWFSDQRLAHDDRWLQGKWLSTTRIGDTWTIEPVE